MKVLCLTDFPVNPPDRWIWNHLDGVNDQVDFLWTESSDRSGRLGKLVSRYPPFWNLAFRALRQTAMHDYDLVVAWESKTGIPLRCCVVSAVKPGHPSSSLRSHPARWLTRSFH